MALGHPGTALNMIAVPYGILAIPAGTARIYHDETIVALVRSHPRVAKEEAFQALEDDLETLLRKMDGWATTWRAAMILRERVSLLRVDNTGTTRRTRRWAPLEPIGALAGGLFGLATKEDAAKLRQTTQKAYNEWKLKNRWLGRSSPHPTRTERDLPGSSRRCLPWPC